MDKSAAKRARDKTSEMATRSVRAHVTPLPDTKIAEEIQKGGDDVETNDSELRPYLVQRSIVLPNEVPFQYVHDSFYVRECYAEYYDKIVGLLYNKKKLKRGVTVTGTPGIGKSVFMAYFFLRYRLEHKDEPIVMISYTKESKMDEVVLWEKGEFRKETYPRELAMLELLDKHCENPNVMYLIDGPPVMDPVENRYVVFTSPNESWFSKTINDITHSRLYMPLWDAEELQDAVDTLKLKIKHPLKLDAFPRDRAADRHDQEVVYRYDVFGGVARLCLECDADAEFFSTQCEELHLAVSSVDLMTGWSKTEGVEFQEKRHKLYHYVPSVDAFDASFKLASPFVSQLLCKRLSELTKDDRKRFMFAAKILDDAAAALCQSSWKALEWEQAQAEDSAEQADWVAEEQIERVGFERWVVFQTGEQDIRVDRRVVLDQRQQQSQSAVGKHQGCFVSCYRLGSASCQCKSLYAVLKQLNIVPQEAALVFVIPECNAAGFKRQNIAASPPLDDSSSLTVVNCFKSAYVTALKGINISTVGDLRDTPPIAKFDENQRATYESAQKLLLRHENEAVVSGSETHLALEQIPQFVLDV